MAGYSGTPLVGKLGIKPGHKLALVAAPAGYLSVLGELPPEAKVVRGAKDPLDFIQLFVKRLSDLEAQLPKCKAAIADNGMVWVSWPKKASGVATDLTEDVIRRVALSIGLVDIKVCAVDDTWSGLKLVIPVKDRAARK